MRDQTYKKEFIIIVFTWSFDEERRFHCYTITTLSQKKSQTLVRLYHWVL